MAANSETALERLAEQLNLPFVHSVSERLGGVLPSLDAMLIASKEPAVVDHYGLARFDLDAGFLPVDQDEGPGLYRYEMPGQGVCNFALTMTLATTLIWLWARGRMPAAWVIRI